LCQVETGGSQVAIDWADARCGVFRENIGPPRKASPTMSKARASIRARASRRARERGGGRHRVKYETFGGKRICEEDIDGNVVRFVIECGGTGEHSGVRGLAGVCEEVGEGG